MSSPTTAICIYCGAALPVGAAATAAGDCPGCGRPVGPAVTVQPGAQSRGTGALPSSTGHGEPETGHRVPVVPLVLLAILCAVMGLALGISLTGRRAAPVRRPEARLPALPPPGPAFTTPVSPVAPQIQPLSPQALGRPPLPPARVTPPQYPMPVARFPVPRAPSLGPRNKALEPRLPNPPAASGVPLKTPGMATVRVSNPSAAPVDVTFAGDTEQSGVVGPRASVDFPIPVGRYNITLGSGPHAQRFYDAPLHEGELLALVYREPLSQRPGERPGPP